MATQENTAVQDIKELMSAWNTIQAAARKQFPDATEEQCYQISKSAMLHALPSLAKPQQYIWAHKL